MKWPYDSNQYDISRRLFGSLPPINKLIAEITKIYFLE